MKKLFTTLAIAAMTAVSFTANAEVASKLYIIGNMTNWDPTKGVELTQKSAGVFTYDADFSGETYFAFTGEVGSWDQINAKRYAPATKNTPAIIGENAMSYQVDASWKIGSGKYTFTIDTNTMKLTISGQAVDLPKKYGIHGNIFTGTWATEDMNESNGIWTLTKDCVAGEFGIMPMNKETGKQDGWIASTDGVLTLDREMSCTTTDTKNWTMTEDGNYTFTFNLKAMTLKVVKNGGGDPNPPTPGRDLYLVGNAYGQWSKDEAYKMTREGNVYTITLEDGLKEAWKIWDGTWDYSFGAGADQPVAGTEADVWFNSATDFTLNTTGKTTIKLTVVEGSDVKDSSIPSKLLVTVEGDPVPPVPGKDLYIVGDYYGGWAKDEAYKMTRDGNVYTITLEDGLKGDWKIFDGDSTEWSYSFGAGGEEEQPVSGTEVNAWFDSATNFYSIETTEKTTIKFTLVEGSDVKDSSIPSKLLVTVGDGPTPPEPDYPNLYIVGQNYGGWALDETFKMSRNKNVYTIILPSLEGEWKIWDGSWDYTFGAGAASPELNEDTEVWFLSPTNFTTNSTNETKIVFTLVEGSAVKDSSIPSIITVISDSGVEGIEADAAEADAVYYNLQGVRVANPENGIFVRVANGKASKVVK